MPKNYSFRKYQPLNLRIWHWLNALVILGLLGTVLLRKTFLSWRSNAKLIEERISATGATITPEVAGKIAKEMRDNMWDWHVYLGFALGALLIYRVIVYFKNRKMILAPSVSAKSSPPSRVWHYNLVKTSYAFFYLAVFFMVITGLILNFEESLHLGEGLEDLVKEAHELMQWFFIVFVVGHIAGVVIAENQKDRGLVSDMINGGDKPS